MSNLKNPPKPERREHESFAMVGISHDTHMGRGARLFGSSLDTHVQTMTLRIHRATQEHDLHRDSYFARECLVEIEMSGAQFVEMISNPNRGNGVPCTLRYLEGETIPPPPKFETEVTRVKANFADELQNMVKVLHERRADVEKLTSGLSVKARRDLRIALDVMIQQVTSNMPFVLEQLNVASEKVVTAAKQEIEQFTQHALRSVGMEALAEGRLPKMLAGNVEHQPCPGCDDSNKAHTCLKGIP